MKQTVRLFSAGVLLLTAFLAAPESRAQNPYELGAEYLRSSGKGYSTSRLALRGESFPGKGSYSAGITWLFASGKSYSVSRGFGLYLGYRYAFGNNPKGSNPFAGARILFSLENFEGKTSRNSLLITPMAEAGYHLMIGRRIFAAPAIGYGLTFKFSKDYNSLDEDVGGRLIPSVSAGYRFRPLPK